MAFGQYLGYICGVVGAIIGGVLGAIGTYGFGAPAGAAWGFAIGSAIGGIAGQVFWPEKADINTPPPPQPHETRLQFSSWGMPIPIQYASGRMAGNIIYMSDIKETIERSKHRQDGVRYYEMIRTYTATFAIAFCEGLVEGIARIWMNNKVLADFRESVSYPAGYDGLYVANIETTIARSAAFFQIYHGSESQTSNSSIAEILGAAEVPAYKGICYIVFIDFPIGEFSGVPNMEIEIGQVPHGFWIERRPIDNNDYQWSFISSDTYGAYLLTAKNGGYLYVSADYGLTWTQAGVTGTWYSGALSSSGQYLIAGNSTRLYMSSDYGVTFSEVQPAGNVNRWWNNVSISSTGQFVLAPATNGRVYLSSNYGGSWSEKQPIGNTNQSWWKCACSKDGAVLMAALNYTSIYISTDSGANWIERKPLGGPAGAEFTDLDCSANGSVIVTCLEGGHVYISTDTGANWTERKPSGAPARNWSGVSCSDSGATIGATYPVGNFYLSNDYGTTWQSITPAAGEVLGGIDMDGSGANIVVCPQKSFAGRIYTYRQ